MSSVNMIQPHSSPIASDIICGAEAIATELLGDAKKRRQVYYLAEKHSLPVFRMGGMLCARRSKLLSWIESQEAAK